MPVLVPMRVGAASLLLRAVVTRLVRVRVGVRVRSRVRVRVRVRVRARARA